MHGAADIYMISSGGAGLARGIAYSKLNIQTIIQHGAGTLGKALALHLAAVLPSATGHTINLDDQYEEDVTTARLPVVDGSSPVPDGIGLGYDVDESAVQRLSQQKLTEPPRHIGILHMGDDSTWYGKGYVSPRTVTGTEEAGVRGFRSELWEDDGTSEFEAMFERVEKEGRVRGA